MLFCSIQAVISTLSGEVIINALVLIVSFAFLFIYSWKVALMALFCVPFYYWIISRNNDLVAARQRDVMSSYAMSESGFINTIEGMSDIKMNFFIRHFKTECTVWDRQS